MKIDSSSKNYLQELTYLKVINDKQAEKRICEDQQFEQVQYETRMHYDPDKIKGVNVDVIV
jgi:hypothetical protein